MKTKERELTYLQKNIADAICHEKLEQIFETVIKPARNKHYRLMKTDAAHEVKQKSYDDFNAILEDNQVRIRQLFSEAYTLYEDILQDKPVLQDRCPNGMTIHIQDLNLDELKVYSDYAAERFMGGLSGAAGSYLPPQPGKLGVEIRLHPGDYHLLHPKDSMYFNRRLADITKLDTEQNELLMYLHQNPTGYGGLMQADLQKETDFLNLLYVEGVQMAKVKELLLQHPDITQSELQEALQLLRIRQDGVRVVEQGVDLMPRPRVVAASVTSDYRHMYVGEGKELTAHPYYTKDIRHEYDDALKKAAEFKLRKLGYIPTLPHSLDVRWADTRGDNWECTQMTQVFNDMFRGYAGKIVQAQQSRDWMRLDLYTDNPEYQKRILDTVNHSWARREVREITDIEEMPEEIAAAQQDARTAKEELHTSFADSDTIYFYEKGTAGYVMMNHDRTFQCYGEPLTDTHMQQIKVLATNQNIRHEGVCVLRLCGPEHLYIDKQEGTLVRACEETIDGQKVLVNRAERAGCDLQSDRYQEVTGRITDATVITRNDASFVRCKLDGVQQMARKLKGEDARYYKNGWADATTLAYRCFAEDLIEPAQERTMGMGR